MLKLPAWFFNVFLKGLSLSRDSTAGFNFKETPQSPQHPECPYSEVERLRAMDFNASDECLMWQGGLSDRLCCSRHVIM